MIEQVQGTRSGGRTQTLPVGRTNVQGASFGERLQQTREAQSINFSKHAAVRAEERGIELTPDLMDRLADSVERAQEKGATNILAFDTDLAFIINVPYGRVITAMSQDEMKNNCFTNIDGAVLL